MSIQPATHQLAQALLESCPGILVSLRDRAVQQFEAKRLIRRLSTALRLDFPSAPLDKCEDAEDLLFLCLDTLITHVHPPCVPFT